MSRLPDNSLLDYSDAVATVAEYFAEGPDRPQWLQRLALHSCDHRSLLVSASLHHVLLMAADNPHKGVLCDLYPLLLHPNLR